MPNEQQVEARTRRLFAAIARQTKGLTVRDQVNVATARGDFDMLSPAMQRVFTELVTETFGDLLG